MKPLNYLLLVLAGICIQIPADGAHLTSYKYASGIASETHLRDFYSLDDANFYKQPTNKNHSFVFNQTNQDKLLTVNNNGSLDETSAKAVEEEITVEISTEETDPSNNLSFEVIISFNQLVIGFVAGDVIVSNGRITDWQAKEGKEFVATIAPIEDGEIMVYVPAGVAKNLDGKTNEAVAEPLSIETTALPPKLKILSFETDPTNKNPFEVWLLFSEDVYDLKREDLEVKNGSASELTQVDKSTYTVELTAAQSGEVELSLKGGSFEDEQGNSNSLEAFYSIHYVDDDLSSGGFRTPDDWIWRNPEPFGGDFKIIEMLKENEFIAGGDYGLIFTTNFDSIQNWQEAIVPEDFYQSVKDIKFFEQENFKHGYAISDNFLLKSKLRGKVWVMDETISELLKNREVLDTSQSEIDTAGNKTGSDQKSFIHNNFINSSGFSDASNKVTKSDSITYFALSFHQDTLFILMQYSGESIVFSRTNSDNWKRIHSISFPDGVYGMDYPYFWSNSKIYKYDDEIENVSFNEQITQVANLPESGEFLYLKMNNTNKTELLKKTEDGNSVNIGSQALDDDDLSAVESGFDPYNGKISIASQNNVYVLTTELYQFKNDLKNYKKITTGGLDPTLPHPLTINDIVQNANNRVVITEDCYVFSSTTELFNPSISQGKGSIVEHSRAVYFSESYPDIGYVVQSNAPYDSTYVYKTTTGGRNWEIYTKITKSLKGVSKFHVLNDDKGIFILDSLGDFYAASDPKLKENEAELKGVNVKDFFFLNQEMGWYLTQDKKLYERDSIAGWQLVKDFKQLPSDNIEVTLNTLNFVNSDVGFVGGRNRLYKTVDGGISWELIISGGATIMSFSVVDENVLFAGTKEGILYMTTDGGSSHDSWKPVQVKLNGENISKPLKNIHFWDKNSGYIVIEDGFLATNNGGESFKLKRAPLGFPVGHEQKTPSLSVLDTKFTRFLYSRGNRTLTSSGFDSRFVPQIFPKAARSNVGGSLMTFDVEDAKEETIIDSVTIDLENMNSALTITAPTNFQVSKTKNASDFTTEIVYTFEEINEINKLVYFIRPLGKNLKNTSSEKYFSGKVVHKSEGARSMKLNVKIGRKGPNDIENSNISQQNKGYELYPNPAKDKLYLKTYDNSIEKIRILNISGKLFTNFLLNKKQLISEIDLNAYPNGMYIIQIISKHQSYEEKIIINR